MFMVTGSCSAAVPEGVGVEDMGAEFSGFEEVDAIGVVSEAGPITYRIKDQYICEFEGARVGSVCRRL